MAMTRRSWENISADLGEIGRTVAGYLTQRARENEDERKRNILYSMIQQQYGPKTVQKDLKKESTVRPGGQTTRENITQLEPLPAGAVQGQPYNVPQTIPGDETVLQNAKLLHSMGLAPSEFLRGLQAMAPQRSVVGSGQTGYMERTEDPFGGRPKYKRLMEGRPEGREKWTPEYIRAVLTGAVPATDQERQYALDMYEMILEQARATAGERTAASDRSWQMRHEKEITQKKADESRRLRADISGYDQELQILRYQHSEAMPSRRDAIAEKIAKVEGMKREAESSLRELESK